VRVGAILHPAVLLAFADGADFEKHGPRPTKRAVGRLSLLCHQHDITSAREKNPYGRPRVSAS
jgi:hypothetical protein